MERLNACAKREIPKESPLQRSLCVLSDSMYDPADPYKSVMAGDIVTVDPSVVPEDGDKVIVSLDGNESLMKLAIENGTRHFRFTAPDRSDFCLSDADAVITGVVTQYQRYYVTHLSGPLKWIGDDIGMRNPCPIRVKLHDRDGREHMVFLREALLAADMFDKSGIQRITEALPFCAEQGDLRPMDLAVWNEFKDNRGIGELKQGGRNNG